MYSAMSSESCRTEHPVYIRECLRGWGTTDQRINLKAVARYRVHMCVFVYIVTENNFALLKAPRIVKR